MASKQATKDLFPTYRGQSARMSSPQVKPCKEEQDAVNDLSHSDLTHGIAEMRSTWCVCECPAAVGDAVVPFCLDPPNEGLRGSRARQSLLTRNYDLRRIGDHKGTQRISIF